MSEEKINGLKKRLNKIKKDTKKLVELTKDYYLVLYTLMVDPIKIHALDLNRCTFCASDLENLECTNCKTKFATN